MAAPIEIVDLVEKFEGILLESLRPREEVIKKKRMVAILAEVIS